MMTENKSSKRTKLRLNIFDICSFFVLALGVLLFIRFFIVNPFTVVGSSMEPTYSNSDFILVDKISTYFSDFKRGDTIIFIPPGQDRPFIKRIIGLPGETVKIQSGEVQICSSGKCKVLKEIYIPEGVKTLATCKKEEFKINDGFFVLGDNRSGSTDSRCCFNALGCISGETREVPENNIIGGVFIRVFPNFGFIK